MKKFVDYINESSLSRLWAKTQDHTCGAISGFRGERTRAENMRANSEILVFLQGRGYSVTRVLGSYIENFGTADANEVSEESYFVANHKVDGDDGGALEKDLVILGQRYDQDSIIVIPVGGKGAYLVGTTRRDNVWPPYGERGAVGDGKFGKASGEFLSRVNGREFAFEHEDVPMPGTINGIRGQKMFVFRLLMEEGYEE